MTASTITLVRDPVCGMEIDPAEAVATLTDSGTTYYFCSEHRSEQFQADIARYASPREVEQSPNSIEQAGSTLLKVGRHALPGPGLNDFGTAIAVAIFGIASA